MQSLSERDHVKKVIKIGLFGCVGLLAALLVGLGIVAFIFRGPLSILIGNKSASGLVGDIPEVTLATLPPVNAGEADWTCWLGNNGDGSAVSNAIPKDLVKGLRKRWMVDYLCLGKGTAVWSAPVVKGNRVVVCGRNESDDLVFCLDPDSGELMWKSSYPAKAQKSYGSGTRATLWIDGDRVYTFGRGGDLACWSLFDGAERWRVNVNDVGGEEPTWGFSSSPMVFEELVAVNAGGSARTVAFDKMTGELRWKAGEGKAGYAALQAISIEGKPAILSFHGDGLSAIDPASGAILWDVPWKTAHDVNATTPVVDGDSVFISSGYGTGCELLEISRNQAKVLWKNKVIASHHSDPFVIDGFVYGYSGQSFQNKGVFKCVELENGSERWSTGEMGWGTAIRIGDHLLCLDIKGNLFLMKLNSDKFVKVAEMPRALGDVNGAVWTRPVVANGKLYLRFMQNLICYDFNSMDDTEMKRSPSESKGMKDVL